MLPPSWFPYSPLCSSPKYSFILRPSVDATHRILSRSYMVNKSSPDPFVPVSILSTVPFLKLLLHPHFAHYFIPDGGFDHKRRERNRGLLSL
uniref:Ovule protein n=1 Tax=Steinernema glaseri TaxID=37863 RepID=A0A1I7Y6X8_9BILA